jgi:2,3,4,5-tetrahydropyridine-2-carboxylate N-succinyltransferase
MDELRRGVEAGDPAAIEETIARLDAGTVRVAEKLDGAWVVNVWV